MGEAYTDRHPERRASRAGLTRAVPPGHGWETAGSSSAGHVGGPAAVDSRLRGYDALGRSKELRPPAWYAAVDRSCAKLYDGSVRSGTPRLPPDHARSLGADALEKLEEGGPAVRPGLRHHRAQPERRRASSAASSHCSAAGTGTLRRYRAATPGSAVERAAIEAETAGRRIFWSASVGEAS